MKNKEIKDAVQMLNKGNNCAQAIFSTFGPALADIDEKTCLKIAEAFGGGIARTGHVCGALTGATMVLGLKYGGNKGEGQEKVNKVVREFLNEFKSIYGSIICNELVGFDVATITPEKIEQVQKEGGFNKCIKIVEDVAILVEKRL
ncbi:MAG: C-GCAxxG-C-C family protein [Candidatus Hodarchaeota archaeon]